MLWPVSFNMCEEVNQSLAQAPPCDDVHLIAGREGYSKICFLLYNILSIKQNKLLFLLLFVVE